MSDGEALLRAQQIALATNAKLVAYPDETEPGVVHVYAKDVALPEGTRAYVWIGVAFPPPANDARPT